MARLWSDEATAADRDACARWRAAHPDHELAWRRLQMFEDKLCSVPGEIAHQALREPVGKHAARRRALQLLAFAGAFGGAAYVASGTDAWRIARADLGTGTGGIREVELPDGSRAVLASASAIDVRFGGSERLVILRAGEMMVETASDPAPVHRPFLVQSRQGRVRALGTRFTVRQGETLSHVAVFEGAVEVRPSDAPGSTVRVGAGQGAFFSASQVQAVRPARESDAAWTRGVLVANDMRVGDLVAELARYRSGLLRCDPAVADLKVTGVFSLRDTDRALRNLATGLPVEVVYRTRYWVSVQPL